MLVVVFSCDVWIVMEARARQAEGRPVVATVGPVTVSTPGQWLLGCLVLWVLAVPLYLVARKA
jgi:hypothetical protein